MKKNGQKGALNEPNERQKVASNVEVGLVEVQGRRHSPRLDNLLCGIVRKGALNEEERGSE